MDDYRLRRHPLVRRDILGIVLHVTDVSGDADAGRRRAAEIEAGIGAILGNPLSGVRLDGALSGYRARHVGRDQKITILFKTDENTKEVYVIHTAFGGQDWLGIAERRAMTDAKGSLRYGFPPSRE